MITRKKTPASRLKQQLVLEQESLTADNMGGSTRSWVEVATLWSEITPIGGREYAFASQLGNATRFRIVLRYRGDILPSMRLRDEATQRIFHIRSVINVEESHQLTEILAESIQPSA